MKVKCICRKIWWDLLYHIELFIVVFIAIITSVGIVVIANLFPYQLLVGCGIGIIAGLIWVLYKLYKYVMYVIEWCKS